MPSPTIDEALAQQPPPPQSLAQNPGILQQLKTAFTTTPGIIPGRSDQPPAAQLTLRQPAPPPPQPPPGAPNQVDPAALQFAQPQGQQQDAPVPRPQYVGAQYINTAGPEEPARPKMPASRPSAMRCRGRSGSPARETTRSRRLRTRKRSPIGSTPTSDA